MEVENGGLEDDFRIMGEKVTLASNMDFFFEKLMSIPDTQGIDHADQSSRTSPRSGLHKGGSPKVPCHK